MKTYGSIIIKNSYVDTIINNYCASDSKEETKDESDESEDADPAEVVEVMPVASLEIPIDQTCKQAKVEMLSLDTFIAEKDTALATKSWLHLVMDKIDKPKPKLKFLRAIDEAEVFTQKVPHDVYMSEFGAIASSSYYDWYLCDELKYDANEIDKIIVQYHKYIAQNTK